MKRLIPMTSTAQQALWTKLSNGEVHVPTQFLITGSVKDGGYDISAVNADEVGFKLIGLRSNYAAKEFVEQLNAKGGTDYDKHVETGTYAWRNHPIPLVKTIQDAGEFQPSATTYIKKSWTENTGGGNMVDFVELSNGQVIGITNESIHCYATVDDYTNGARYYKAIHLSGGSDNIGTIKVEIRGGVAYCEDERVEIIDHDEREAEEDFVPADTTIADHMEKRVAERESTFLVKMNDGRGDKPYQVTESRLRELWDLDQEGDYEKLEDWLETCEVGDSWESGTDRIERIS